LELARTELEILSDEVPIEPTVDPDDESVMSLEDIIAASEELDKATKEVTSSAISGYETLKSVLESYNDTNVVTIDQAQKLIDAGYGEAVSINQLTGEVSLNMAYLRLLAIAKADAAIAASQDQLAIWQETTAIESQEAVLIQNINLLRQRRAAIVGADPNSIDLLKAISGFAGVAKAAGGATSATNKLAEAQKESYQLQIKGYEAQKKNLDSQKKALEDQKKAYHDIIDAQKESLKLTKEENDYQDEVEQRNKELADIDNELFRIMNDNSEEGKANKLRLEEEKAKKIEEINKAQAERTYDIEIQALDAEAEAYDRMVDRQIAGIEVMISGFDAMIDKINEMIDALGRMGNAGGTSGGSSGGTGVVSKPKINTTPLGESSFEYTSGNIPIGSYAYLVAQQEVLRRRAAGQMVGGGFHSGGLVESHHDGDFAGSLRSNEVFSKLLKGEYVSTEAQMKNFLSDILPKMMVGSSAMIQNKGGSSNGINIGDININVSGNLDKAVLPEMREMIMKTVVEATKKIGIVRNAKSYTV
jgi:hypothetical protein